MLVAVPSESCRISVLFFPYSHFLIFITLSVTSPCVVQGAKLRPGSLKICICRHSEYKVGGSQNDACHAQPVCLFLTGNMNAA